jgi:transcriptional regulator with XRE-family HTH domain
MTDPAPKQQRIHERLRAVRERAGLTQVEAVARMGGFHRSALNDLEKGRRDNPTLENLARVALGYDMTLGELLYGVYYPLEDVASEKVGESPNGEARAARRTRR